MASEKLTDRRVETAKCPQGIDRVEIWDALLPGFGLRLTKNGVKTWCVMYRLDGKKCRMTLGAYPRVSLADAREAAKEALKLVAQGKDPVLIAKLAKETETRKRADTVKALLDAYETQYVIAHNKSHEALYTLRAKLARWNDLPVADITKEMARKLLSDVKRQSNEAGTRGVIANRTFSYARACWNWATREDLATSNPFAGLTRAVPEIPRDRCLTNAEIARLWPAWLTLGEPFGHFFRLLLLLGQRRGETAAMKWADLDDLDGTEPTWRIPAELSKNDQPHTVPLSPAAVAIIKQLRAKADPGTKWVFPAGRGSVECISGFSKGKTRGDALANRPKAGEAPLPDGNLFVTPYVIHDLRRSAATGMAKLGVAPHIIEATLNHKSGSLSDIAKVYNTFNYLPQGRAALTLWACNVLYITGTTAGDLKAAGYKLVDMKAVGIPAEELKAAEYSPDELKAVGFTARELKDAKFSAADLSQVGFTRKDLKDAGFSCEEIQALDAAGSNIVHLHAAG